MDEAGYGMHAGRQTDRQADRVLAALLAAALAPSYHLRSCTYLYPPPSLTHHSLASFQHTTHPHVHNTTNRQQHPTNQPQADKLESGDVGFALYEKVHRAKNRWRCSLRYGVFLINGKEYMFNKANTDFTF